MSASHGIQGSATADKEGIPARNNAAQTADNQNLGHSITIESNGHSIGRYQASDLIHRIADHGIIHQKADSSDNKRIKGYGQHNG